MGIKTYRPTTAGLRHRTGLTYDELTARPAPQAPPRLPAQVRRPGQPGAPVDAQPRRRAQEACTGSSTSGGTRSTSPASIETIEYDPNRSSFISLVKYRDGERRYILSPQDLKVGQEIVSSNAQVDILPGNAMPLRFIPLGHGHPQHRAPEGQGRPGRQVGRRPAPRSWPRKGTTPRSACRRPRSARSTSTAGRRSARSATSTTRTSASARPAGAAGWAGSPTSAARP